MKTDTPSKPTLKLLVLTFFLCLPFLAASTTPEKEGESERDSLAVTFEKSIIDELEGALFIYANDTTPDYENLSDQETEKRITILWSKVRSYGPAFIYWEAQKIFLANDFKKKTFVNLYIEPSLDDKGPMTRILQKAFGNQKHFKREPYITVRPTFVPVDEQGLTYRLQVAVEASPLVASKLRNIDKAALLLTTGEGSPIQLSKSTFIDFSVLLDDIAGQIGNSFRPPFVIGYGNGILLDGDVVSYVKKLSPRLEFTALDSDLNPLKGSKVEWANAVPNEDGNKAVVEMREGLNSKDFSLTYKGKTSIVTVRKRKIGFDPKELIKEQLLAILQPRKKLDQDTLKIAQADLANLDEGVISQLGLFEAGNLELVGGSEFKVANKVSEVITVSDSSYFRDNEERKKGFDYLRRRKGLARRVRTRLNYIGLVDLLVEDPRELETLADLIVRNSGRLIAQIMLGDERLRDGGLREAVTKYLNANIAVLSQQRVVAITQTPDQLPIIQLTDQPTVTGTDSRVYINPYIPFKNGTQKDQFEQQINTYLSGLDRNVFVNISYSQDVSAESYRKRTKWGRPVGLPPHFEYFNIDYVNIPGSVKALIKMEGAAIAMDGLDFNDKPALFTTAINRALGEANEGSEGDQGDPFKEYVIEQLGQLYSSTSRTVLGLGYCQKCQSEGTGINREISDDNKVLNIIGNNTKCTFYLYDAASDDVAMRDDPEVTDQVAGLLEGNYYDNGVDDARALFALLNRNLIADLPHPVFPCSDYLSDFLKTYDHCSTDQIGQQVFDELFASIDACLQGKFSVIASGDFDLLQASLDQPILPDEKFRIKLKDGDIEQELFSAGMSANEKEDIKISFEKLPNGTWDSSFEVNKEYLTNLGYSEAEANELLDLLLELYNKSEVKFCDNVLSPDCFRRILNFWQVMRINIKSAIETGTSHHAMWDDDPKEPYENVQDLIRPEMRWHPMVGASVDAATESVTSIPLLVVTIGEVALDPEQQEAFKQMFSEEGWNAIKDQFIADLGTTITDPDKLTYTTSKASVELVLAYAVLIGKAAGTIKQAVSWLKKMAGNMDNSPKLVAYLKRLVKETKDAARAKKLEKLLDQFDSDQVEKLIKDLTPEQVDNFLDDFSDNIILVQRFLDEESLVNVWKVVKDAPDAVKRNTDNLEKLSRFISETGMEESKLISSFGNTKNPQKWIDMKIPESELDAVYDGFKNSPPAKFEAWTPEHKAQRWTNHKAGKPNADYKTWSNQYDGNIDKAIAANRGVDNFYSGLSGNVVREKSFPDISITTSEGTKTFTRRLDIVDEDAFKGIEFKEYSSGKVYRSPDISREYILDGKILKDDLLDEIEWIFKGCEPSAPLRTDLETLGIKVTLLP